jgi:hypothetical protein
MTALLGIGCALPDHPVQFPAPLDLPAEHPVVCNAPLHSQQQAAKFQQQAAET